MIVSDRFVAHDGRELTLRAIQPDDAAALQRAFSRLTPEQVRARFFYRMTELTDAMAERLCRVDPDLVAAYVVTDADGEIRGEARIHIDTVTESAEFAIAIDPAFTEQGVGSALMRRLLDECSRRGLIELWGDVLADNHTMLQFARSLGAERVAAHPDPDPGIVRVRFSVARADRR
jgi:acetyltransferase